MSIRHYKPMYRYGIYLVKVIIYHYVLVCSKMIQESLSKWHIQLNYLTADVPWATINTQYKASLWIAHHYVPIHQMLYCTACFLFYSRSFIELLLACYHLYHWAQSNYSVCNIHTISYKAMSSATVKSPRIILQNVGNFVVSFVRAIALYLWQYLPDTKLGIRHAPQINVCQCLGFNMSAHLHWRGA
jgi:hypothetical protein